MPDIIDVANGPAHRCEFTATIAPAAEPTDDMDGKRAALWRCTSMDTEPFFTHLSTRWYCQQCNDLMADPEASHLGEGGVPDRFALVGE